MTLRKLALGSALGMLASGLAAYLLPLPQASPPAPAPSLSTAEDAAPTPTERAAHLAEMEQEIARLRALLDAGPGDGSATAPEDASLSAPEDDPALALEDAGPPPEAQNASKRQAVYGPLPQMSALRPGECRDAMTPQEFAALMHWLPGMQQLPPDELKRIKSASPNCACAPTPQGQARCESWCASQSFAAFQGVCDHGWCRCGLAVFPHP